MSNIILNPCNCKSSWCPKCFALYRSAAIVTRLLRLDWKCTRTITLTIDPRLYPDPQQIFELLQSDKAISRLMRDLKRYHGVEIRDWVRVLEWHRSGHPHYHLFVDVGEVGRAGQIGYDLIQSLWKYGHVSEGWVRDEHHWKQLTGYFKKHGYFLKDKKHQSILPEWAVNYGKPIRRFDSKHIRCKYPKSIENKALEAGKNALEIINRVLEEEKIMEQKLNGCSDLEEKKIEKAKFVGYAVILRRCGMRTMFRVDGAVLIEGALSIGGNFLRGKIRRRYNDIVEDLHFHGLGRQEPGIGWVVPMDSEDIRDFLNYIDSPKKYVQHYPREWEMESEKFIPRELIDIKV